MWLRAQGQAILNLFSQSYFKMRALIDRERNECSSQAQPGGARGEVLVVAHKQMVEQLFCWRKEPGGESTATLLAGHVARRYVARAAMPQEPGNAANAPHTLLTPGALVPGWLGDYNGFSG